MILLKNRSKIIFLKNIFFLMELFGIQPSNSMKQKINRIFFPQTITNPELEIKHIKALHNQQRIHSQAAVVTIVNQVAARERKKRKNSLVTDSVSLNGEMIKVFSCITSSTTHSIALFCFSSSFPLLALDSLPLMTLRHHSDTHFQSQLLHH